MAKKAVKPKVVKATFKPPTATPQPIGNAPRGKPEASSTANAVSAVVLDRLWSVVLQRRNADPAVSHSARLLSRGTAKVAQKFGEEAVECLIEAVAGNTAALVAESADVLYHLLVLWVDAGVEPQTVWAELERREGVSGVAEKAARPRPVLASGGTRKIP
jgi:phosphoribosyl-ATP pyrophosphohydrolase